MTALPVQRLTARWVELLDADCEVIRVLFCGEDAIYRVVPHRNRTWRVERRGKLARFPCWIEVAGAPRGPYARRVVRTWRSPEAAMRAVEGMTEIKVFPDEKGEAGT